jgi:hypothetical protein
MARKLLKDDPLDAAKPDLMQRAVQRGMGREAPEAVGNTEEIKKSLNKETNQYLKEEINKEISPSINKSDDLKTVTTRIPDSLDLRIKMYALKSRRKKEDIIREALEFFLDAKED